MSLLFGAIALIAVAGARMMETMHLSLRPCPFLALTGHPCPTCYGTRSLAAIGRGDLIGAFVMQPLVTAAVLLLVAWALAAVIFPSIRNGFSPMRLSPAARKTTGWAAAVLVAANWAFLLLNN